MAKSRHWQWKVADKPYVCTACGRRFAHRERRFGMVNLNADGAVRTDQDSDSLGDHWALNPTCRNSLSRPVGHFGAKTREHCDDCHAYDEAATTVPCRAHAFRGCPAC
jgi:hypothetical protein